MRNPSRFRTLGEHSNVCFTIRFAVGNWYFQVCSWACFFALYEIAFVSRNGFALLTVSLQLPADLVIAFCYLLLLLPLCQRTLFLPFPLRSTVRDRTCAGQMGLKTMGSLPYSTLPFLGGRPAMREPKVEIAVAISFPFLWAWICKFISWTWSLILFGSYLWFVFMVRVLGRGRVILNYC